MYITPQEEMTLVNNINNLDKWKKHFLDMVEGKKSNIKNVYLLKNNKSKQVGGGADPTIKLVTPTQQAVERAKSDLKRSIDDEKMAPTAIKRARIIKKVSKQKKHRTQRRSSTKTKTKAAKGKTKKRRKRKKDKFGEY